MDKPNRSTYTSLDFKSWNDEKTLIVAPKFQRRGVWTTPAKSFLIDTLIRQLPVPPLYIRVRQDDDRKRMIREIVDGQQRISAVLGYLNNEFGISPSLDTPYGGKKFDKLPREAQDAILQYPFICEVMQGVSDKEILEIFARLNLNSVPLNSQELRNGRFFGLFKRTAYSLAYEHVELWKRLRLFTDQSIARMSEVEFTSELLILQIDGLQDKKKTIDSFYEQFDEVFPDRERIADRFRLTIDTINDTAGKLIPETPFRRLPLFYSLYSAVYHRLFRLPSEKLSSPAKKLNAGEKESLKSVIADLASALELAKESASSGVPSLQRFVYACLSQTDNIEPRRVRFETIYKRAFLKG